MPVHMGSSGPTRRCPKGLTRANRPGARLLVDFEVRSSFSQAARANGARQVRGAIAEAPGVRRFASAAAALPWHARFARASTASSYTPAAAAPSATPALVSAKPRGKVRSTFSEPTLSHSPGAKAAVARRDPSPRPTRYDRRQRRARSGRAPGRAAGPASKLRLWSRNRGCRTRRAAPGRRAWRKLDRAGCSTEYILRSARCTETDPRSSRSSKPPCWRLGKNPRKPLNWAKCAGIVDAQPTPPLRPRRQARGGA